MYKLRNPSPKYLASLSTYDSSDPTKDWAFPDLSVSKKISIQFKSTQKHKSEATGEKVLKDLSILSDQPSASVKVAFAFKKLNPSSFAVVVYVNNIINNKYMESIKI